MNTQRSNSSYKLPPAETLTVEFKSDRKRLPDTDLVEALVGLANTEGGELWLGVEDDGRATGLHADHMALMGLVGLVAARTSPALQVDVASVDVEGIKVARIRVPKAHGEVATQAGVYLRRRIKHDAHARMCAHVAARTHQPGVELWAGGCVSPTRAGLHAGRF